MPQATWPLFPHPLLLRQFQILRKIDSFLKNVSNVLISLLNRLNYIQLLVSIFSLPLWITGETRAYSKKLFLLNSRLRLGTQFLEPQNTLIFYWQLQQCKWFFKQKTISASLLIAGIHSSSKSKKLKELMNGQIIHFYSPSKCTLFIWRISTDKTF